MNNRANAPKWDSTAAFHERILIEVLIDIRDILEMRFREINSDIYKIAQKD